LRPIPKQRDAGHLFNNGTARDYVFKTLKLPVLIRRGYNQKIDKIALGKEQTKNDYKRYKKEFKHLYTLCKQYRGTTLADSLEKHLDLEEYMQWLAFNRLVRNGDYTDEVYFYFDTVKNKFRIVPWDYDDLFSIHPHEGIEERKKTEGGSLIFSSEDLLDKTIIRHIYLYRKYIEELNEMCDRLNNECILEKLRNTYCSVLPYYMDKAVLETTRYDKYGLTNTHKLRTTKTEKLNYFTAHRALIKSLIDEF
jgi:spore coat protein H